DRRLHGFAGSDAVIDQNDQPAAYIQRLSLPEKLDTLVYPFPRLCDLPVEACFRKIAIDHNVIIQMGGAIFSDSADSHFLKPRETDFFHSDDVMFAAQCPGDCLSDYYAATRYGKHQQVRTIGLCNGWISEQPIG